MPLIEESVKTMLPTAPENMVNALQTDAAWWATHYDDLSMKFEQWLVGGNRGPWGSVR
jgi:hypothetical protein